MTRKRRPSIQTLNQCFRYDPRTGKLYWRVRPRKHFATVAAWRMFNSRFAGREAGHLNANGHRGTYLKAYGYLPVSHIIWKLSYGEWPKEIDYINRNPNDLRLTNLREVPHSRVVGNHKLYCTNTSGHTGVIFYQNKWRAYIFDNGRYIHLGTFETKREAILARKEAEIEYNYVPKRRSA